MKKTLSVICLLAGMALAPGPGTAQTTDMKMKADRASLLRCRQGMQLLLDTMAARPDLFPGQKQGGVRMLSDDQKSAVRRLWQSFLDYELSLESLRQPYAGFYKSGGQASQRDAFLLFYHAFLAQYRCALDFIALTENDPSLHVVLNEPASDLQLRADTYADFKFHYLNVAIASEFAALAALSAYYGTVDAPESMKAAEEDKARIWRHGKGTGEALTAENALAIVKKAGLQSFMPVQQGVSEWMGDTKVWRRNACLISPRQIRDLAHTLEPGDMLFERREWYVSNVGLPGFWSHAALYIGTPQERRAFFSGDDGLCSWIREQGGGAACDFEGLLQAKCPGAYGLSLKKQEGGHAPRVLEAISEGVSFTTIEHSAACDSLGALRPRLSKTEKARAVLKAFQYSGRPYDFNFDFLTDASLVCSELIYKCYEPSAGYTGLSFPLIDLLGRTVTPPNDMVRQFDSQFGTPAQQSDLVIFYDGRELERKAVQAPVDEFRKSWQRPKWHVLTKEGNKKTPG
jgi:hypothetical protein